MGRTTMETTSTASALDQIVLDNIAGSIAVKQAFIDDADLVAKCVKAAELLSRALHAGRRAFLMGNGGSAADAQHIAAELVGRYKMERRGLPVMALNVNTSCLTAIGNDYSYEMVFARQMEAFASRGDVAIGISTSGNSRNVLRGACWLLEKSARTRSASPDRGGGANAFGCRSLSLRAVRRHATHPGISYFDWTHSFGHCGAGTFRDLIRANGEAMRATKQKFVLLDRDGVINRHIAGGYVTSWDEFEFLPRSLQGLRLLAEHGYAALVVSNQACVGKGLLTEEDLSSITKRFVAEVTASGGNIRAVYYCTHRADEQGCSCRKPQPAFLLKAQAEHDFHFADTFVVGDSVSDIEAALRVGAPAASRFFRRQRRTISNASTASRTVRSLYEAAEMIVAAEPDNVSSDAGQPRPRDEKITDMGIHIAAPATGISQLICERSPRIALFTDAASADSLPCHNPRRGGLSRAERPVGHWAKGDSEGIGRRIDLVPGREQPLGGTPAEWRPRIFSFSPFATRGLTIHWPCLENADLLGLEPRIQIAGAKRILCNPLLRVAGSAPSQKMKAAWSENRTYWAHLSLAIWQELETPGAGVDPPSRFVATKVETRSAPVRAVASESDCCVDAPGRLDESRGTARSRQEGVRWLSGSFSTCMALLYLLQNKIAKAIKLLESALGPGNPGYAGSGGENTYRARYLLGTICDTVGQQEKAVNYWMPCVNERPVFEPAVRASIAAANSSRAKPHGCISLLAKWCGGSRDSLGRF